MENPQALPGNRLKNLGGYSLATIGLVFCLVSFIAPIAPAVVIAGSLILGALALYMGIKSKSTALMIYSATVVLVPLVLYTYFLIQGAGQIREARRQFQQTQQIREESPSP
jgi:hydrogenase-4 membrane subunit HyfE